MVILIIRDEIAIGNKMLYDIRMHNNFLSNTIHKHLVRYQLNDTDKVFFWVRAWIARSFLGFFFIERSIAVMEARNIPLFVIFVQLLASVLVYLVCSIFAITFLSFWLFNKLFFPFGNSSLGFDVQLCWDKICPSLIFGLNANLCPLNSFQQNIVLI